MTSDDVFLRVFSLQVSESQGKVRTYFIRTMRTKSSMLETDGRLRVRTGGRLTLAEVVFNLVQARHMEKIREANGSIAPTPYTLQC